MFMNQLGDGYFFRCCIHSLGKAQKKSQVKMDPLEISILPPLLTAIVNKVGILGDPRNLII
jgi:hypothetical protein